MYKLIWTDIKTRGKETEERFDLIKDPIRVIGEEQLGKRKSIMSYEILFEKRSKSQILLFLIYLICVCKMRLDHFEIIDNYKNVLFYEKDLYQKEQYEKVFKENKGFYSTR